MAEPASTDCGMVRDVVRTSFDPMTGVLTHMAFARRWRALRTWMTAHWFAINASVFSVVCLAAVSDVYFNGGDGGDGRQADAFAYVLLVGQTLPLAFRRRYPLGTMYLASASIGLYWVMDYPFGFDGAAVIAIYSGAAYGLGRRRAWRHLTVVILAVSFLAWAPWSTVELDDSAVVNYGFIVLHIAAALLGEVVYQRRQRIADLEQRAIQAEETLELRAQMAVADERQRIAREMHDVVAHGMSVISVQAAAAQEIAQTNPEKTIEVLANIEGVGRESLTELRRMLGVLRDSGGEESALAPQPGLAEIADAVAQSNGAGLPAELTVTGSPHAAPAGVQLAAYRIVQEALTNSRKHAGESASAVVRLAYLDSSITVEVTDDGAGAMSSLSSTGAGNGLVGMRERVEIYGGEFTAGPRAGGGFSVTASLPMSGATNRPTVASARQPKSEKI
jgi:signal transduction histidine kinase